MHTQIDKSIFLTILLLFIAAIIISPSLASESPQLQPTYTPQATYTPQGTIPTATPTAFPTSTPYGGIATENTLPETFDILSSLGEKNNFLGNYSISEPHRDEQERLQGVEGYCIDIGDNPTGEWFGAICFYRDMETECSAADRLRVLWHDENDFFISNAPTLGQGSRFYERTDDEGNLGGYSGDLIYGNWMGLFDFRVLENKETLPEIEKIIKALLQGFPEPDKEPPASTQEEMAMSSQYTWEYFYPLFFEDSILPRGFVFGGENITPSWAGAENKLCYDVDFENNRIGNICLFRDNRPELSPELRLVQFDIGKDEDLLRDMPQFGEASKIFLLPMEDERTFRHGIFAQGSWLGEFVLESNPDIDVIERIEPLINALLPVLDNAPANLSQDRHEFPDEDIFTDAFSDDELPPNITVGPYQHNWDSYEMKFNLYYGSKYEQEGKILIWDAGSSFFNENFHPLPIEAPAVGDYSFMSYTGRDDPNKFNITYFVQKNNFYIALTLENRGNETQAALVQLAEAIIEDIPQAPYIDLPTNGGFIEEQFMSCFPKQSELGFEHPMYQYEWETRRTRQGFKYSAWYHTSGNAPTFTFHHLDINMVVNLVSFGGQDIGMSQISTPVPSINERAFAHIREPMYANLTPIYDNQLSFQKGPVITTFNIASSVYDPSILDQMVTLAQQVSDCLPENPILPKDISPPSDPQTETVNTSYVSVRGMINTVDSPEADISNLPVVDKGIWENRIGLILNIKKELTAPFTAMIYSTKYGVYSARWQGHDRVSEQEYEIWVEPDRESVELGEHIFYLWMGDELIISYPFYIGHWEGKEE